MKHYWSHSKIVLSSVLCIVVSFLVGRQASAQTFLNIPPLAFTMSAGGTNPLPQILTTVSTGTNFTFTATATTNSGGSWLAVTPSGNCCLTPEVLSVSISGATLAAGTYTGQVSLTSTHGNLTVPVSLTVASTGPFFADTAGGLSFTLLTGAAAVSPQTININKAGSGILTWAGAASTADGGAWLTLSSAGGNAPASLTVSVNLGALPGGGQVAGTFIGQISLAATGSSVTIPVSVSVGSSVFRQVNPLSFNMPAGGPNPLPQIVGLASTGTNITFNATALTGKGGAWLTVSPSGNECCGTPEALTVSLNATALPAGTYTGEITFTQFLSNAQALAVPVTLTVSAGTRPFFDNLPGQMSFSLATGQTVIPAQTFQVRNGGAGTLRWTAVTSTADGSNWLTVSPPSGRAPGSVSIAISPALLPGGGQVAGTFVGQVSFSTTGGSVTVPVSVVVGASVFRQINPISFTMPAGGPNPLPQILSLASTGSNITFNAVANTSKGGAWLSVSPSGNECCQAPESVTVSVNATTLAAGTYTGQVTFTQFLSDAMAITVPVTLTVTSGGAYFDNIPGQTTFSFVPSAGNPPSQTLQILNGGGGTLTWSGKTNTADGGAWLSISPKSGTAPGTVTIAVRTLNLPGGGLTAGHFIGQVSLQTSNGNVTVPVSVTIGDPVFVQVPALSFSTVLGIDPDPQMITIASTSSSIRFNATAVSAKGGAWLSTIPSGNECCLTPEVITVKVDSSALSPGTYVGQLTFSQFLSFAQDTTVPVVLTVGP